ncbi:MAG TPA: hypothetical protein VN176_17455 [Verrucomicrobiae bacterium]|jgi:hypothetical protein|nr:hypothetical protein [Verrucomicrobiae bacterium]
MDRQKKFYVALAVYAVLGILIWITIDDIPLYESGLLRITLRRLTLIVVGMFALRTVLHWHAQRIGAAEGEQEEEQVRADTETLSARALKMESRAEAAAEFVSEVEDLIQR